MRGRAEGAVIGFKGLGGVGMWAGTAEVRDANTTKNNYRTITGEFPRSLAASPPSFPWPNKYNQSNAMLTTHFLFPF